MVAPSTFDAVIFDLDGTLADTLHDIATSMNRALSDYDVAALPIEAYKRHLGGGVFELARRASPQQLHSRVDDIVASFRRYYRENWVGTSVPYAGVAELLATLAARGIPKAVLSNKPQAPATAVVRALFANVDFVAVYGARDGIPKKPDPTAAIAIAAELGVAASRCAFVGDTPIDIHTGVNAGMVPVGVSWGFRPADELRHAGAKHVLVHPSDLMTLP